MRMVAHTDEAVGTGIGACMGFAKGILGIQVMLTWGNIFETAVLATIGSAVGFLITHGMKWAKKKLFGND